MKEPKNGSSYPGFAHSGNKSGTSWTRCLVWWQGLPFIHQTVNWLFYLGKSFPSTIGGTIAFELMLEDLASVVYLTAIKGGRLMWASRLLSWKSPSVVWTVISWCLQQHFNFCTKQDIYEQSSWFCHSNDPNWNLPVKQEELHAHLARKVKSN